MLDYFTAHLKNFHATTSTWDGPCVLIHLSSPIQLQDNTQYLCEVLWSNTVICWTDSTNTTLCSTTETGTQSFPFLILFRTSKNSIYNPQTYSNFYFTQQTFLRWRSARRMDPDLWRSSFYKDQRWFSYGSSKQKGWSLWDVQDGCLVNRKYR